jgi:hypothetical protein
MSSWFPSGCVELWMTTRVSNGTGSNPLPKINTHCFLLPSSQSTLPFCRTGYLPQQVMGPSSTSTHFPRLTGTDNFDTWKTRVRAHLDGKNLLHLVEGPNYDLNVSLSRMMMKRWSPPATKTRTRTRATTTWSRPLPMTTSATMMTTTMMTTHPFLQPKSAA